MTTDALRDICLALYASEETFPFRESLACFKVAGKMFALLPLDADPAVISLKCEPGLAEQLRAAHPEIVPGYHLNKRHWNTVTCSGSLPETMVADLVEDSYDLVVSGLPAKQRRALLWEPERRKR